MEGNDRKEKRKEKEGREWNGVDKSLIVSKPYFSSTEYERSYNVGTSVGVTAVACRELNFLKSQSEAKCFDVDETDYAETSSAKLKPSSPQRSI